MHQSTPATKQFVKHLLDNTFHSSILSNT